MKSGEFGINQAEGVILGSKIKLGEKVYAKGYALTPDDLIIFKMFDMYSIYGWIYEEGDVDFRTCLRQVAAQLMGDNLGYVLDDEGVCKIVATCDGVLATNTTRIEKFNRFNNSIVLNTIDAFTLVKKGDIVAKLEAYPPLIEEKEVDDILFRLGGNISMFNVQKVEEKRVAFVYPHLLNDDDENAKFTSLATKFIANMSDFGLSFRNEIDSRFNKESLANAIEDGVGAVNDIVVVLSPIKGTGKKGLIAEAVQDITNEIMCYEMSIVGGGDLLAAKSKKSLIIALPFDYDNIDTTNIDMEIRKIIFSEHLTGDEIFVSPILSGNVEKIADETAVNIISSKNQQGKSDKANIGIVVLAAGQGKRAGVNKLLIPNKDNEPLFLNAVKAAIESDAKPVFVVTGYRNEAMEKYLQQFDVVVLHNKAYATGIKTSISMGLRAVPAACDGAILLPADMPCITAVEINKLISKFDKKMGKQVCVLSHKGIKNNPILWEKSLYAEADIVPENANMRTVFAEYADFTKQVEIKDGKKLSDVNLPGDVKLYADS